MIDFGTGGAMLPSKVTTIVGTSIALAFKVQPAPVAFELITGIAVFWVVVFLFSNLILVSKKF